MPKPRTARAERRRLTRQTATRLVAERLADLAANPPVPLPADLLPIFRDQVEHFMPSRPRARSARAALSDSDDMGLPGSPENPAGMR